MKFYVCFNFFTFQDEFACFANEIKSGRPKEHTLNFSIVNSPAQSTANGFPNSSRFYSQILGDDPEHLINEKECAPCCDGAFC